MKKTSSLPDWLPGAAIGTVVIVAAVVLLFRSALNEAQVQLPAKTYPIISQEHVTNGTIIAASEYNSNPPTSGKHWQDPKKSGIYKEALPDAQLIHNLEHGHVWISYTPALGADSVGKIEDLARSYGQKIVVTPRAANDAPIAVAAWGVVMNLQAYDETLIRSFIREYINKGPEQVPDMGI